jgi:hypothetical protein
MTKLIICFRNFVNSPKSVLRSFCGWGFRLRTLIKGCQRKSTESTAVFDNEVTKVKGP